jgi:hypothetical protein
MEHQKTEIAWLRILGEERTVNGVPTRADEVKLMPKAEILRKPGVIKTGRKIKGFDEYVLGSRRLVDIFLKVTKNER